MRQTILLSANHPDAGDGDESSTGGQANMDKRMDKRMAQFATS